MNFSKIVNKADEGVWIDIVGPNGEATDVKVKVLGADSKAYKDRQKELMDRRIKNRKMTISAEDIENEALSTLASCVVAWEGVCDDNGAIKHSDAAVRKLLKENNWLREQIDAEVSDRSRFLSGFETN